MRTADAVWLKRSRLEKSLMVLFLVGLIVIIALSITVGIQRQQITLDTSSRPCNTKECVRIAYESLSSIEEDIDPCEDFYEFSCGQWLKDTTLVTGSASRFTQISDKLSLKIKDLLDDKNSSHPVHFKKAQMFYDACMNYTSREGNQLFELITDMEAMGGWPLLLGDKWDSSSFDWMETLKKMLSFGYDNSPLVQIGLSSDYKNTSIMRVYILHSSLGLDDENWFEMEYIMQLYRHSLLSYALTLCRDMSCNATTETMEAEIDKAVDIEIQLAKMHYPKLYINDYNKSYNPMTIKELQESSPEIDWLSLIKLYYPGQPIEQDEVVIVTMPGFMKQLSQLMKNLKEAPDGMRNLANYMMYRQIKEASAHLTQSLGRIDTDMQNYITGIISGSDLWDDCVTLTSAVFQFSVSSVFAKRYIPEGQKESVRDLVDHMRDELATIINKTTWMDSATRDKALFKLYKIYVMSIYPDGLLDDSVVDKFYDSLSINSEDTHYQNFVKANIFMLKKQTEGYGKPSDRSDWTQFPSTLLDANAFYTTQNNSIFVPIGIIHDWFFDKNAPQFSNYGRIGFVLGHELGHAFDDTGAQMDYEGNWINWWDEETKNEFKMHRECLVSTFNNFTWVYGNKSIPLNGTISLGENIADDVGLQESYQAYKKVSAGNSMIPGIGLTADQLFWVNFAMIWCEKETPETTEELIKSDEHPPSKFRVNSPLSNSDAFLHDFGCQLGTTMNPSTSKCHVWGS